MSWLKSLFGMSTKAEKPQASAKESGASDDDVAEKPAEAVDKIQILIELLQCGNEKEREKAIVDLWNTHDPRAVSPLLIALNDSSWKVKRRAIESFRYVCNDQAILPLIQLLKTEKDISLKAEAATTLARLRAKDAIDALKEILLDNDNADTLIWSGGRYHDFIRNALKSLGGLPKVQHLSDLQGITREIAISLKSWYRDKAISWWEDNKASESAVCDDGNEPLRPGEGFLRPGNYLCCESHTDSLLCNTDWVQALKNLEGYFGPGLPDHIKSLARRSAEETSDKA